jgi:TPR repeat protein
MTLRHKAISALLIALMSFISHGQAKAKAIDELVFEPVKSIQKDNDKIPLIVKLRKAAKQGDANAQFTLAKTFMGQGLTPETEQEAAKWLRQIVINKNDELMLPAFLLLGEMRKIIRNEYPNVTDAEMEKSYDSIGISIAQSGNIHSGINAAIREAKLLHAPAQIWLTTFYSNNEYIRLQHPRILEFITQMANEGLPRAMHIMGRIVINGWGVQQNFREAIRWFRRAAEYELDDAQHELGIVYSEGLGVPQNIKAATKWFKLAAKQGNAASQNYLKTLYADRKSVEEKVILEKTTADNASSAPIQIEQAKTYAQAQAPLIEGTDWELDVSGDFITLSLTGRITHGDRQRFTFKRGSCGTVIHNFSTYTTEPANFKKVVGRIFSIEFNGEMINARLEGEYDVAMIGRLLYFGLGGYKKDVLLSHLRKDNKITIKFIDGNGFKTSDYFDVPRNEWSIVGITEAFGKAYQVCSQ